MAVAAGAAAGRRQPSETHRWLGNLEFRNFIFNLRDGDINSYAQFYSPTSHDQRKPCGTKNILQGIFKGVILMK